MTAGDALGSDEEAEAALGSARRFWLVLACFFLSGFAALIYQTAWTRQFSFVFGTSELAVATVLAAYMGGLAAGAGLAARFAPRVQRPILAYGLIELGIAVAALAVPLGIRIARSIYLASFGAAGEPPGEGGLTSALFYLACTFVILFPATALMGATLPLLARYAVRSEREIGSRIGALYTANTVGAVAGTALAGFALLPSIGLRWTVWVAVAVNALVFGAAALLARGAGAAPQAARDRSSLAGRSSWILPLIALSGSASFVYEVLWTRMLGQILGGSVYAFATMLSTFLAGIAIGSWVASRLASTRGKSVRGFAWAQLGAAALALLAFKLADRLPELARSFDASSTLGDAALCALVMLPSTLFIGATFPFAVRIHARDETDASPSSARVYSWNTIGSILGAVGAGFFLVPMLGYSGSMRGAAALNLAIAFAASLQLRPLRRPLVAIAACGLVAVAVVRPAEPWKLLSSSPLSRTPGSGELLFFEVGRSSTVQLRQSEGLFGLLTNGLQEAIIEPPSAAFAFSPLAPWMAGLPVLARPEARSMLVVGLGGGGVVEAAPSSLERIDVVELEPEVVAANRLIGAERAHDPLSDPRVHVTVNDARGSLLLTKRRYDAIVSQPSHPWTAGASHLYTREFFELARDRLNDDGVLVQWMGLSFVDESLLQILVASLHAVFEHVNLYAPIHGGVLLIASAEPLSLQDGADRILAQTPLAFASMGVFSAEDVASALILDDQAAREFSAGAPINTDDYNLLQTRSPAIARAGKLGVQVESLVPEPDPISRAFQDLDSARVARGFSQRRFWTRAEKFAATLDDPGERALAEALLSGTRSSFQKAHDLAPDSDDAKLGLVSSLLLRSATEPSEVDDLIASIRDDATRATAEGLRFQARLEDAEAVTLEWRRLEARLAGCLPTQSCFVATLRQRAGWRITSEDPQRHREAYELVERFASLLSAPTDVLLRARVAVLVGNHRGALALARRVEFSIGQGRNRPELAREAARVLSSVPREELDPASLARLARFRKLAAAGGGAGQRRIAR